MSAFVRCLPGDAALGAMTVFLSIQTPTQQACADVARVRLFFSFRFCGKFYPCALVHWYSRIGDSPDEDTGMWRVR